MGGGATPQSVGDLVDTSLRGGAQDWEKSPRSRFGGIFDKYEIKATRTGGGWAKKLDEESKIKHWDVAPSKEYFQELARISKNQIIWGGNYFYLPPTRCFLVWRKLTISESFSMAMCEYAWTSFNENAKWIELAPQGKDRFHPTQKPVALYAWILQNYAKRGDKILDTHVGSASSLIACHRMGFEAWGFELDVDYFRAASERLEKEKAMSPLFEPQEIYKQEGLTFDQ
ncbi:MAG: site-specific DNA-methyltransferase [Clostridia bacterium]|nr:site-specific DNA-methyltransferase [Clostridia bacterium]